MRLNTRLKLSVLMVIIIATGFPLLVSTALPSWASIDKVLPPLLNQVCFKTKNVYSGNK
jgi:hypothetical protein